MQSVHVQPEQFFGPKAAPEATRGKWYRKHNQLKQVFVWISLREAFYIQVKGLN